MYYFFPFIPYDTDVSSILDDLATSSVNDKMEHNEGMWTLTRLT